MTTTGGLPARIHGITRGRLDAALGRLWEHRLALVVGPAGAGKTTLLAQFSERADARVEWFRGEARDSTAETMVETVARLTGDGIRDGSGDGTGHGIGDGTGHGIGHGIGDGIGDGVGDGVGDGIVAPASGRYLLVVDDVHLLEGTPAEHQLARLVDESPASLALLIAGRRPPRLNLSRLRVSGELLEIGPDDLRFRSWEVEELFRNFYREPLSPEDLATLARRTEGWAAGLQLFHLATRGKPARERQRVIRSLAVGSRLVREYLARNVLDELPSELTHFLVSTCVLGTMTGPLCDALLGTSGSEPILAELERRHVFTTVSDDGGTYRYHEVLRSHLEMLLVERDGEAPTRAWYRRAAALLVAEGMLPEALRAYGRAEDWEAATALLQSRGEEVIEGGHGVIETLPAPLGDHDPWLRLATARRSLAAGRWQEALAQYRVAEDNFESAAGADVCRRERIALAAWLDPFPKPAVDWAGVVRRGVQRDPLGGQARAATLPGHTGRLASGLLLLAAGHVRDARPALEAVASEAEADAVPALVALVASTVAELLADEAPDADGIERLSKTADQMGLPWLARLVRALLAWSDRAGGDHDAETFARYARRNEDPWGQAIAAFVLGVAALRAGHDAVEFLETATEASRSVGSGVLEAWSRAAGSVARARAGDPEARPAALHAETIARAAGARGAQALAFAALGMFGGHAAAEYSALADAIAAECGLSLVAFLGAALPAQAAADGEGGDEAREVRDSGPPPVAVRCFGGFAIALFGRTVDCSAVKPRARAALQLLALHAPRPVHRDTIVEALWPEVDPKAGARNLHVVISTLRRLLEPGVARGASALVVRDGEAYRLDLPAGSVCDLAGFKAALEAAKSATAGGDESRAAAAYAQALDLYRGDLLAGAGSADWMVRARDGFRWDAVCAAQALAELELARGDPVAAAAACDRGLGLDRYRDPLWRLRVRASEAAGDVADAARARLAYRDVLAELGIDGDSSGGRITPV